MPRTSPTAQLVLPQVQRTLAQADSELTRALEMAAASRIVAVRIRNKCHELIAQLGRLRGVDAAQAAINKANEILLQVGKL